MRMRTLFRYCLLLFCLCLLPLSAYCSSIAAASCSQSDVQAAINKAADGDTVSVPAGNCTWTVPVAFCKSILLQGSGSGTTGTVIAVNISGGFGNDGIFVDSCQNKNLIRITGFAFQDSSVDAFGLIYFHASSGTTIRVDHNTFSSNGPLGRAITVGGKTVGVIDHNTVTNLGILIEDLLGNESNAGDSSWTQPMSFSTANAMYIEDNTLNFTTNSVDLDCDNGGRVVWRHNMITGDGIGNHGFDSVPRGCMEMDVHDNTINSAGTAFIGVQYRGGTGVVFNNLIQGVFTGRPFGVTNYRSISGGFLGGFTNHGYCNGTSPNDQNTSGFNGWACRDQVGRGTNQNSFPLYQWNNCVTALGCTPGNSGAVVVQVYDDQAGTSFLSQHIVPNRDYYEAVATFDGTKGVGQGTLAARPGTCTAGVGYFATDTNTLYNCTGNAWATYFTPFTYPHPLQSGKTPPLPPPTVNIVIN